MNDGLLAEQAAELTTYTSLSRVSSPYAPRKGAA
jgi:hypothetical protein